MIFFVQQFLIFITQHTKQTKKCTLHYNDACAPRACANTMDFDEAVLAVGIRETYALLRAVKKWRANTEFVEPRTERRKQQQLSKAVKKWRHYAALRKA